MYKSWGVEIGGCQMIEVEGLCWPAYTFGDFGSQHPTLLKNKKNRFRSRKISNIPMIKKAKKIMKSRISFGVQALKSSEQIKHIKIYYVRNEHIKTHCNLCIAQM